MLIGGKSRVNPENIKGFTLAEVMVALSIMAIALVVLFQSVILGVKLTDKIKETVVSIFLMESKMAEIETAFGDGNLSGSGNFDGDFKNFEWVVNVEIVTPFDEEAALKMEKVTVFVFPKGEVKENGLEAATYLRCIEN